MNINVFSPDFLVTASIKRNVVERVRKLYDMNSSIQSVAVFLRKEKRHFVIVAKLHLTGSKKGSKSVTVVKEKQNTFYRALSSMEGRLKNVVAKKPSKRRFRREKITERLMEA